MACEAFKKALEQYTNKLSDGHKAAFCSGSDVMSEIQKLNKDSRVTSDLGDRVQKVLNCIKQFMGTLAIFIQHSPEFSALAVGGMNCILLVRYCYDIISDLVKISGLICACVQLALGYIEFFTNLTEMMERIVDHLKYLSEYGSSVFQKHKAVQDVCIIFYPVSLPGLLT